MSDNARGGNGDAGEVNARGGEKESGEVNARGGNGDVDEVNARGGEEESGETNDLTHTDETGDVQMVNVGEKPDTARRAVARGELHLAASTVDAIRTDGVKKGDVLATARIGAVQAVKHTWETIPMCHQIPITNVDTDFEVADDRVTLTVAVETTGKTGCEMEALEGVTTGLNVVWDMVKAAEKDESGNYPGTRLTDVEVVRKEKRVLE